MDEVDWSPEGVERLMRSMDSGLRKDPSEVETGAVTRRQERAKAERIPAALPGSLREQEQFLKRNVPDHLIDGRLARRREARGIPEGPESRLSAQVDKDRVEERLRFALADRFGSELLKREVDTLLSGLNEFVRKRTVRIFDRFHAVLIYGLKPRAVPFADVSSAYVLKYQDRSATFRAVRPVPMKWWNNEH